MINFMMAMFYNTIISWAVYYLVMTFLSLGSTLPWKECGHWWNTNCCVPAIAQEYEYTLQLANLTREAINRTAANATSMLRQASDANCSRPAYSTEEFF